MAANPTPLKNMKLFGRKYQLTVTLPGEGSSGQQVLTLADSEFASALRVTFDVQTVFYQVAWYAEIVVYNLDQATTQSLIAGAGKTSQPTLTSSGGSLLVTPIKQGMVATLSAGYQNGNYGAIWTGPVFQAMFVRENVTDFKMTLRCLLWLDPLTRSFVNSTFAALTTQTDVLQKLSDKAFGNSYGAPKISPTVKTTQLSRGKTVFGSVSKFFSQMADDNNMQWFLGPRGLNFARVDDNIATDQQARVFTPETGLIGTPQQTQYGVSFRILLDPTVVVKYPAMLVNIDNSQIIQYKKTIGELPGILDQSGTYIVMGARYIGDTRGTPWYTEITGLTSVNGKWAAAQYLAERASLNHG